MNKDLLDKLCSQPSSLTFPPAVKADTARAVEQLKEMNFAVPTPDYLAFLSYCDGYYYDGLELFGIRTHLRMSKQYTFPNLVEQNRNFCQYTFFIGKLIIGRISEHFIIYDEHNKLYAIVDRVNLCSMVEFSDFDGLLSTLCQLCSTAG